MNIKFIEIDPKEIWLCFPEFYAPKKMFLEINKEGKPIGFYGIKKISKEVGEISVYINIQDRKEITKSVAIS